MGADRALKWAVTGFAALLLLITVLYLEPVYEAAGWRAVAWVYNTITVLAALAGTVLAFMLWQASDRGEVLKGVWGSLGLGLLLWACGEAIWAYYQLALNEGTTVSVADIAWAVGYLPLVLSLVWRYRSLRAVPTRQQLQVGLGAFAVLTLLVLALVIRPMVASDDFDSGTEKFLLIFYPLGDLGIVFFALLSVLVLVGGTLYRPVVLVTIGFLAVALSDLLYSYTGWQGSYLYEGVNTVTALVDISYVGSYMIIALGLLMQARLQRVL